MTSPRVSLSESVSSIKWPQGVQDSYWTSANQESKLSACNYSKLQMLPNKFL